MAELTRNAPLGRTPCQGPSLAHGSTAAAATMERKAAAAVLRAERRGLRRPGLVRRAAGTAAAQETPLQHCWQLCQVQISFHFFIKKLISFNNKISKFVIEFLICEGSIWSMSRAAALNCSSSTGNTNHPSPPSITPASGWVWSCLKSYGSSIPSSQASPPSFTSSLAKR